MSGGLLSIGLVTLDVLGRPIDAVAAGSGSTLIDEIALIPAGTAGGTALVAAVRGVPTSVASAVGNDGAGRFVRHELESRGVDTALLDVSISMRTSTTILTIRRNGERPNFHAIGASSFCEITPAVIAAALEAKFVHWGGVGGVRLDGGPGAELLAAAKEAGAVVTCDLIVPGPQTMDELTRLLPHVDYFMPNMDEGLQLAQATKPQDAARRFMDLGAKACIFKWGAHGSFVASGDTYDLVPAHAIDVVDTTSCGDSYCAGFIAALDHGFALTDACRFGTATAALVAQGLGTLGKLESFEATLDYMRNAPVRSAL